jgi:prolipoprotein diacylglyceryl transferase
MITQNIDPIILKLGSLQLRYYGILFGSGILTAYFIQRHFFRKWGYQDKIVDKLLIYLVVTIVLMAHLVHLVFYEPSAFTDPSRWHRIYEIGTGLASHGGFLGGLLGLFIFIKVYPEYKIPYLKYADILFVGGAVFPAFVRTGNFFNSEIYGRATDMPWAVTFLRRDNIPRHPSQIYEMVVGLIIFAIIYFFYNKNYRRIKNGTIMTMFIVLYFSTRFFLEYFKEYQFLSDSFPLTMGQLLSIPLVLIGLYILFVKKYYQLLPEEVEMPTGFGTIHENENNDKPDSDLKGEKLNSNKIQKINYNKKSKKKNK